MVVAQGHTPAKGRETEGCPSSSSESTILLLFSLIASAGSGLTDGDSLRFERSAANITNHNVERDFDLDTYVFSRQTRRRPYPGAFCTVPKET